MNELSNGATRSAVDVGFFALCFIGLLTTAAGIIATAPWAAALGILTILVGVAYFAICEFL